MAAFSRLSTVRHWHSTEPELAEVLYVRGMPPDVPGDVQGRSQGTGKTTFGNDLTQSLEEPRAEKPRTASRSASLGLVVLRVDRWEGKLAK